MELFDSHAHLTDRAFADDREEVISRTFSAGVTRILEIACAPGDWENGAALSLNHPGKIFLALGVHPHNCDTFNEEEEARLKEFFKNGRAVAVGETGLDYARNRHPADIQKEVFLKMLKLAAEISKPVVLHCRNAPPGEAAPDAYGEMLEILRLKMPRLENRRFSGVLHCFSGSEADAVKALDLGFALGVNGTITYPKNNGLRAVIKKAGLKNLMLETDCPYLPPQSARGKRNDPSFLPEITAALAGIFGTAPEIIADRTTENCLELFLR